jgi:glutamyl-tRNA synthetase
VEPAALPRTGPVADLGLLDHICGVHMRRLDPAALFAITCAWLDWVVEHGDDPAVFEVAAGQGRRATTVSRQDLVAFRGAFTADRAHTERILALEPERYRKLGAIVLLTRFYYAALSATPPRDLLTRAAGGEAATATSLLRHYLALPRPTPSEEVWQQAVYRLAAAAEVRPGAVFMLLRVALTGTERTPPLYPIVALLGEDEVHRRLHAALAALS